MTPMRLPLIVSSDQNDVRKAGSPPMTWYMLIALRGEPQGEPQRAPLETLTVRSRPPRSRPLCSVCHARVGSQSSCCLCLSRALWLEFRLTRCARLASSSCAHSRSSRKCASPSIRCPTTQAPSTRISSQATPSRSTGARESSRSTRLSSTPTSIPTPSGPRNCSSTLARAGALPLIRSYRAESRLDGLDTVRTLWRLTRVHVDRCVPLRTGRSFAWI